MQNEILAVLEYMEKEKGIPREEMVKAISQAIRGAAQKGINAGAELRIEVNPQNGSLNAWSTLEVVDTVFDPAKQIALDKARALAPDVELGNFVEKPITPAELGRISAQTARQILLQTVRQFEKERIYDDYKGVVGDIVTGTVRRRERNNLIVDLGKAEATLTSKERVPGEDYAAGDRIRCLLLAIEPTMRGPEIILSRASVKFVRRLFALEVAEIADGTVTIEAISREPGYRTKIAVDSQDPKVDPVGACVGARGARVKSIVRELSGEKIDIIRYHPDIEIMLEEAIKPAIPRNVRVDEGERRIYFEVAEDHLSIAIGRRGQNARLTSKLLGWRLEITKEQTVDHGFEARRKEAIKGWEGVPGVSEELAEFLVGQGLISPETFEGVEAASLMEMGFDEESANQVIAIVNDFRSPQS